MRLVTVVGLISAGLVLAGCGSEAVSGDAETEGVAAGEPVFSPCDEIPDGLLTKLGLDPATESRDILGVAQPGWKLCRWPGSDHSVTVLATTRTVEEVRANTRNVDFVDQRIGGRESFTYREATDSRRETCDVAFRAGEGTTIVRIGLFEVNQQSGDPCQLAIQTATTLEPVIPG
ncbi:uncharacterized protein DUF3558 [Rhodococcus sp. AG1013]|uniref:DUF3558 domain-containing protein n=1 Tax=Rhodococcus sp. AG1013 TaxID=2183996 RepID=UPI000E0A224D|nr:DUF3558 domain-containing protein [Rhodococcus sp. AG1013]RDI24033.1 uncharacterized protein DUF3558 [Rhodococcus sp. AG1013]